MKSRLSMILVALVCGAWAIFPDPFPFLIDDIIAAFLAVAAILKFIKTTLLKTA